MLRWQDVRLEGIGGGDVWLPFRPDPVQASPLLA